MAFDEPKLPRATLHGEKLYLEGEGEPYFRDTENTIRLRIDALTIYRGYEPERLHQADRQSPHRILARRGQT